MFTLYMAEANNRYCTCELCQPNEWLGAREPQYVYQPTQEDLEQLEADHLAKIRAARHERELALVSG